MSSELDDAFAELKDAKAEAIGQREFILIDGIKHDALVDQITTDDAFVSGGIAQAGSFRVQVAKKEFADPPVRFQSAVVRDNELQILTVDETNGVTYELKIGDPTAED